MASVWDGDTSGTFKALLFIFTILGVLPVSRGKVTSSIPMDCRVLLHKSIEAQTISELRLHSTGHMAVCRFPQGENSSVAIVGDWIGSENTVLFIIYVVLFCFPT